MHLLEDLQIYYYTLRLPSNERSRLYVGMASSINGENNIAAISRDVPQVLETVSSFVQWVSKQFEELYVEVGIIPSLKDKPVRKKEKNSR